MTSVSEDMILFLPCTVPAPGSLSVNSPVSLELGLCEFFTALFEVGFLHNGFLSVPVSYLTLSIWSNISLLRFIGPSRYSWHWRMTGRCGEQPRVPSIGLYWHVLASWATDPQPKLWHMFSADKGCSLITDQWAVLEQKVAVCQHCLVTILVTILWLVDLFYICWRLGSEVGFHG